MDEPERTTPWRRWSSPVWPAIKSRAYRCARDGVRTSRGSLLAEFVEQVKATQLPSSGVESDLQTVSGVTFVARERVATTVKRRDPRQQEPHPHPPTILANQSSICRTL